MCGVGGHHVVPVAHPDPHALFGQAGECPALWVDLDSAPGVGYSLGQAWRWTRPMVVWDLLHANVAMEVDLPAHGKSPCSFGMIPAQNEQKASQH